MHARWPLLIQIVFEADQIRGLTAGEVEAKQVEYVVRAERREERDAAERLGKHLQAVVEHEEVLTRTVVADLVGRGLGEGGPLQIT